MEVTLNLKDELSSAGMRPGVPSVMVSGQPLMLMWLVDSWDLHQQVCILNFLGTNSSWSTKLQEQLHALMPSSVRELVPSGLMTCSVVVMSVD